MVAEAAGFETLLFLALTAGAAGFEPFFLSFINSTCRLSMLVLFLVNHTLITSETLCSTGFSKLLYKHSRACRNSLYKDGFVSWDDLSLERRSVLIKRLPLRLYMMQGYFSRRKLDIHTKNPPLFKSTNLYSSLKNITEHLLIRSFSFPSTSFPRYLMLLPSSHTW